MAQMLKWIPKQPEIPVSLLTPGTVTMACPICAGEGFVCEVTERSETLADFAMALHFRTVHHIRGDVA